MWLTECPKTTVSEYPLESNVLRGPKHLGTLFNTLTTDHMNSCYNSQKFELEVQTKLSSKPSTFSATFIPFSRSTESFDHFEKKVTFIGGICPKLLIPKNVFT